MLQNQMIFTIIGQLLIGFLLTFWVLSIVWFVYRLAPSLWNSWREQKADRAFSAQMKELTRDYR